MIFNRKKIEKLNEEIKSLAKRVADLTKENESMDNEISHLTSENKAMKKTVTNVVNHNQELIKKNQQLDVDLNEATETIARQMRTIFQLETKLDRLSTWKRRQRNEKGQFIRKEK